MAAASIPRLTACRYIHVCPTCGAERMIRKDRPSHKCRPCATRQRATSHGASRPGQKTRLYRIWGAMRARCNNPNVRCYPSYGGRGISIYPEWVEYEAFHSWAYAHGYADDLTIERNDVNGNYCPENCCFIPLAMQARNRRDTKLSMEKAREIRAAIESGATVSALSRQYGVSRPVIAGIRDGKGWLEHGNGLP